MRSGKGAKIIISLLLFHTGLLSPVTITSPYDDPATWQLTFSSQFRFFEKGLEKKSVIFCRQPTFISRGTNVPLLASALTQLLPKAKWISPISKWLISFPDLLWMKPKTRSGKVRKFVFLDWLLHLTQVFHGRLSSNLRGEKLNNYKSVAQEI